MDAELFLVYVENALLPALKSGDAVVMDNVAGHKLAKARTLIEPAEATLLNLPPYPPDFNSIEMIWSKVKRLLRSVAARTIQTPDHAFGYATDAVTTADIQGCNLAAHKVAGVAAALEAVGCRAVYLPPYSPDMSPIEPIWSKAKSIIKSLEARTVPDLEAAVTLALEQITAQDCQNCFSNCGYSLHLK